MGKKGQAALEYLMTYSWALVAIAIVIGVLIFMGILKAPSAGTCTGLEKLAYEDHTIDSNGNFILYLKNGAGMQISISSVLPGEDFSGNCSASSPIINATKDFNIVCINTGISAGQTYNGKITIEYMRRNARHTESAACSGTAPLTGIFLLASAPQIIEGFFAGVGGNLDLNNPDEMMLGMGGVSYASFGSYTSNIFDANSTMDWSASISWDENVPAGTDINLQTRTSDNNIAFSAWSGYYTNPSGEAITSPNGRFIQYKANLSTTNPALTPKLLEVRMHGNPLAQSCGNLKKEGSEQCDTNDLAGQNCILLGYSSGTLACSGACAFDTNGCVGAAPNQAPFAGLSASTYSANIGTYITFDGNSSYDPDGNIVNYAWNFGDGNIVANGASITYHAYAFAGDYNATLTVTDNNSATDSNIVSINIASGPIGFCPITKVWTTQSDWQGGSDVNIDKNSSPGNLLLATSGEIVPDQNTKLLLHLSEGFGLTAADSSGNGNNGTLVNEPTWTSSGKFGNALSFDGVNDYVTIPDTSDWDFGTGNFTVAFWIRPNTTTQTYKALISCREGNTGNNKWIINFYDSNNIIEVHTGSTIMITASDALAADAWTHVAWVRSGSAATLYLNAVSKGTYSDSFNYNDCRTLTISKEPGYTSLDGLMDEIRIWKGKGLSAAELQQYLIETAYHPSGTWNATFDSNSIASDWNIINWGEDLNYGGELTADANTKALWHLNEGSGTTTADSSGNGNNGTINGSAVWTNNCKFGNCLIFDGVNDYVGMADSPSLYLGSGNFTMGVWAKFNSTAGTQIFFGQNPSASRQFTLLWRTSDGKLVFSYSTNGSTPIEATYSWSPTTNVWYYIALVRNGSDLNAYVNGAQIGSAYNIGSAILYNSTASFYIGENVTEGGYFFNGTMDEIVISGDALNANEILNNYKRGIANLRLRTRTADTNANLAGASWSSHYTASPSAITSDANRFIEVQALLETENAAYTPVLQDLNISCS